MGTDIHGVFQARAGERWKDIPSKYDFDRHYQLFAVLAGVRNGFGFAGLPIGEEVTAIAAPRGIPGDFAIDENREHPLASVDLLPEWRRKYHENGEPAYAWMGDHSFSHLTGAEMLGWFATAPVVVHYGVLSRAEYEAWDKVTPPTSYCGGVSGHNVVTVEQEDVLRPGWTHIRVSWEASLKNELAYFFDEVKRLADEHGEIRFVFGFDS